jgi:formate-dependent nitrite reductase membrane component NrfD
VLPALFTVSALSSGVMATIVVTYVYDMFMYGTNYASDMRHILAIAMLIVLVVEAAVFALYLHRRYYSAEGQSRTSVRLLLFGKLKSVFWLGTVASGFAVPLLFGLVYLVFPSLTFFLLAGGLLGLLGRFFLRVGIVYAGIKDQTPLHKFMELQYYLNYPGAGEIPIPRV